MRRRCAKTKQCFAIEVSPLAVHPQSCFEGIPPEKGIIGKAVTRQPIVLRFPFSRLLSQRHPHLTASTTPSSQRLLSKLFRFLEECVSDFALKNQANVCDKFGRIGSAGNAYSQRILSNTYCCSKPLQPTQFGACRRGRSTTEALSFSAWGASVSVVAATVTRQGECPHRAWEES